VCQCTQLHLQRKTAWSNKSLVGCRINCLVDYKEWFEGLVLQYHKSGKHYVEFRQVNEKRWLVMKKIAFYILERPPPAVAQEGEYKDDSDCEGLAPVEVLPRDRRIEQPGLTNIIVFSYRRMTGYIAKTSVWTTPSRSPCCLKSTETTSRRPGT
jgi:hypothetical protein